MNYSVDWLHVALGHIVDDDEVSIEATMAITQAKFDAYRNCALDDIAIHDRNKQKEYILDVDPTLSNRLTQTAKNIAATEVYILPNNIDNIKL
jgi:hypothetical protein